MENVPEKNNDCVEMETYVQKGSENIPSYKCAQEEIKPDICLNQLTTRKCKLYQQCKFCVE